MPKGEIVQFPVRHDEEAPEQYSAEVRVIPSIDFRRLPGHDVAGAARACWQWIARRDVDRARSYWIEHRRELAKRASVGYSEAAIDRMLLGYKEAVRVEIARLQAAARQAKPEARGET